jgi:hypothetical protein
VQSGSGAVFAASGTHRVTFARATAGTQTIRFQDPVNSSFNDLVLGRPIVDTVRLLTDVLAGDSAILTGSTVLASTAFEALKTPATGALRVHGNAVLRPSRVEIGSFFADSDFVGAVRIFPDTAVFLNGGFLANAPAYAWRSVRLVAGSLSSNGVTLNGNLIIQGGLYSLNLNTDSVTGFLRTEGAGVLGMTNAEGEVMVVQDSAVFAGGDETNNLSGGTLRLRGNFVQRGPTGSSFQATAFHTTEFAGSTRQTITFATPGTGAAQSTFGVLSLARRNATGAQPTAVVLTSPIFAAGYVQDTSAGAADTILGGGNTVTTNGLILNNTVVDRAPLVVNATSTIIGNVIRFQNMDPAVNQLTFSGLNSFTVSSLTFATTPNAGVFMLVVRNQAAAGPITGTFLTSSPSATVMQTPQALYQRQGSPLAIISWNGVTLP